MADQDLSKQGNETEQEFQARLREHHRKNGENDSKKEQNTQNNAQSK